jgi:hypothetical protein
MKIDISSANGQSYFPVTDLNRNSDPYLANEVSTIAECSLRHYKWGENTYGAPAGGGVPSFLKEFPHIVNLYRAFKKYQ